MDRPDLSSSYRSRDSLSWLEDRTSAKALEWVRAQNQRTIASLSAYSEYAHSYQAVMQLGLEAGRHSIPGDGVLAWIYENFVYEVRPGPTNPRGVLRRAPLPAFYHQLGGNEPSWTDLLDIDLLGAREHRAYMLVGASSFGDRALLAFSDGERELLWREFDLSKREFVAGGFNFRSSTNPVWKDRDTILVGSPPIADDQKTQSQKPLAIVALSRNSTIELARVMYSTERRDGITGVAPIEVEDYSKHHEILIVEISATADHRYLRLDEDGEVHRLAFPPRATMFTKCMGNWYFVLKQDWRTAGKTFAAGSVISVRDRDISSDAPSARLVLSPGARETIDVIVSTRSAVIAIVHSNVRGRLLLLDARKDHGDFHDVGLPDFGNITLGMRGAVGERTVLVRFESFLQPTSLYSVDAGSGTAALIAQKNPEFNSSRLMAEQHDAISADGTKIPYFIVRGKDLPFDGAAPTILTAYGGNGLSYYPSYDGVLGRLWLEKGGVYVLANIRGGGEFGPAWHTAALKANRERSFEDVLAVARDLIRRNITSPLRLGLVGYSNGGGLMEILVNRHSEMFGAVVSENGVLDWLRNDLQSAQEMVRAERGSPEIPDEREFLERVSPYQNLAASHSRPPSMIVTNTSDDVVFPGMSRRFAARLAELGLPYYFYEAPEGGHAQYVTYEQRALYSALKYTFLSETLRLQKGDGHAAHKGIG